MLLLNTEESILKDLDISTPKAFIIQKRLSTITEDVNRIQARRKEFYRKIGEEVRKLNQYAYYRRVTGKRSRTETSPIENMKPINHSIMKNLLANTNLQRFVGKPDSYSDYRRILGKRDIDLENRNVAGIPVLAERLPRQFRIISNIAEASLSSHSLSNFQFNEFGPRLKSAKNRF